MPRAPLNLLSLALLTGCASMSTTADTTLWHVKAVRADGSFVDVKAIDVDGTILDVKAIETPGNLHLLDVKALRGDEILDVKLLPGDDGRSPLRAITPAGATLAVVALPRDGGRLPVAGVRRDGSVYQIRAIDAGGTLLGIKAISPDGHLLDVEGLAFDGAAMAGAVHGVAFQAHVKAIPQESGSADTERRWTVRAIDPAGASVPVRALAGDGTTFDLHAFEVPGDRHVMDVKALRDGDRIAVKVGTGADGAVVAITSSGDVLPVVATLPGGTDLPVRAVRRHGNIFDVKAIGPDGAFWGVKAVSPEGFLHDVKGLKLRATDVEGDVAGVPFEAHVKSLPQVLR
ncbi:MAG: hypothetical protein IPM29_23270 [Planctomycetes bacterium]|nr:hypothetical protein [Planctomycetota bacterium]